MKRGRSLFQHKPRSIVSQAKDDEAEIVLYDEISDWGVTAEGFRQELEAITAKTIHLRINSPGGSVFDAMAMFNSLRAHPAHVVSHIDGLAASAATVVALGGNEVRIAANAFFMIHDPWLWTAGNAAQLRKDADLLDKLGGSIVDTYAAKTEATVADVKAWMEAETWFTAAEAVDAGFADALDTTEEEDDLAAAAAALFDLSIYSHVPDALRARGSEPTEPTTRELEQALRDAGLSRAVAARMVAAGREGLRDAGSAETHLQQAALAVAHLQLGIHSLKEVMS